MPRRRMCDVAEEVLREFDAPAVMWGDAGLLDEIAKRAGSVRRNPLLLRSGQRTDDMPLVRWQRVLGALARQPGNLVPGHTVIGGGRVVRIFWLPEAKR